jgi:hypothetical protein
VSDEVYSDGYFAVVPEWVLDADVSAQAIRLYAVLRRYADQHSGQAFPSRRTLAARLRVASTRTVDAALDDLLRIGAVDISAQVRGDGGNGTSRYTVRGVQKPRNVQKSRTPAQQTAPGGAADCTPPVQQIAQAPAQQTAQLEPEPLEPKPRNQTPAPTEQGADEDGRHLRAVDDEEAKLRGKLAQTLAAEHYEATGKLGGSKAFLAVRGIVLGALTAGHAEQQIRAALAHLRARGRSVTNPTLGPLLADPRTVTSNGYRPKQTGPYRNPDPRTDPDAFTGAF